MLLFYCHVYFVVISNYEKNFKGEKPIVYSNSQYFLGRPSNRPGKRNLLIGLSGKWVLVAPLTETCLTGTAFGEICQWTPHGPPLVALPWRFLNRLETYSMSLFEIPRLTPPSGCSSQLLAEDPFLAGNTTLFVLPVELCRGHRNTWDGSIFCIK